VTPPYILDFAACTLDAPPAGFDPDDAEWTGEQARKFGRDWPDVRQVLKSSGSTASTTPTCLRRTSACGRECSADGDHQR
jgi:hypothetical protein